MKKLKLIMMVDEKGKLIHSIFGPKNRVEELAQKFFNRYNLRLIKKIESKDKTIWHVFN